MSRFVGYFHEAFSGFPRVSGDEPAFYHSSTTSKQFSPRERG